MTSRYYAPGSRRGERVRELFSRIAGRYDLINDLQSAGLHRFWKRKLVQIAGLRGQEVVLDVCCGTGDLAVRLARVGGQVFAADFTPQMLAAGLKKHGRQLTWVQADALELPFPDQSFDVVTIGYGLRNLADFAQGIRELTRVLKAGGTVLILDFGKPSNRWFRAVYFGYLRLVVPIFGRVFCGDSAAYRYILDSLEQYPAQAGVTRLLEDAGCERVEVSNFLGGAMSLHRARKR